jgi:hypothetical protein
MDLLTQIQQFIARSVLRPNSKVIDREGAFDILNKKKRAGTDTTKKVSNRKGNRLLGPR